MFCSFPDENCLQVEVHLHLEQKVLLHLRVVIQNLSMRMMIMMTPVYMNHHLACSQVPSVVVSESKSDWPLAVDQAIVKGVFGHVLNRDDIVNILKKKFSVQPRNLTNLKPTELTSVLARKLVRYDSCRVKEVVKNNGDITVLKEIAF